MDMSKYMIAEVRCGYGQIDNQITALTELSVRVYSLTFYAIVIVIVIVVKGQTEND